VKKVVIIGGVAGGASTAARLRRNDESAQILILEKGPYISFANCGMPYHVGGVIPRREDLLLVSPERMRERFNVEVRTGSEVTAIDREHKTVLVRETESGRCYAESYDVLVLSPGAEPVVPPIPGIDGEGIFTIWTIPQMDRILGWIDTRQPDHAVVVGGGYVGVEMAENLRERGLDVALVEMMDQVLSSLDYDMAQWCHRELRERGVELRLGEQVAAFEPTSDGIRVRLQSGDTIETGLVVLAMGVKPRSDLARQAGLVLNDRGAIVVNERMETSDPVIYAVGDAVQVTDAVSGEPASILLAGPANKQGRIAANVIAGIEDSYTGTLGASVVKVFSLTAAAVGHNSRRLATRGMVRGKDYHEVVVRPLSHAGYYPGAVQMTLKVLFDREGKILGAQAVGKDGVAKRIDVIAAAMKLGAKIGDLARLELCYAPPYGSAKDPVNIAGFVAENLLRGNELAYWDEIPNLGENTIILDTRTEGEYRRGHMQGAVNIPVDELRDRITELPRDKEIVAYCAVGQRAYYAQRILGQRGYRVRNLAGGYSHYETVAGKYTK
jgi:NADPH-dependent 2,4-dienoyl-CoA reductase/sulfur reductase-like enzyme/rhodanese-related sulfurtransferase